jgi:hypothetical protein
MTQSRVMVILLSSCLLAACSVTSGKNAPRNSESGHAITIYRDVAGVVQGFGSQPGDTTLFIQLDDIPSFVGPSGRPERISKMTLPFRVNSNALAGLKVGDRITFDAEVDWDAATPGTARNIRNSQLR